jgi:antitoxin (DNA-binding transcriptional repressor) of toxin-antitoxin stability system
MLFPVIEVKVVGATVITATNGPVVRLVAVTRPKPALPIEYWIA